MSTYEYVDADGRAVALVSRSLDNARRAAFRFERDRTGDDALADKAAGTVERQS